MITSRILVFCLVFCLLFYFNTGNAKRRNRKPHRQRRLIVVEQHRGRHQSKLQHPEDQNPPTAITNEVIPMINGLKQSVRKSSRKTSESRRRRNRRRSKNHRNRSKNRRNRSKNRRSDKRQRNRATRTEVIKETELSLGGLYGYLNPVYWLEKWPDSLGPSSTVHKEGVVRLKRLYCRVGIGYHLEIRENGSVTANHAQTPFSLVEIFSVKRSVVGIRSAKSSLYLCMNKAGKIHVQKTFQPECQFRENIEKNNFNTYASEIYSDHVNRKGYFLAITKHGRIPRRMKRGSWMKKRAHWLPRTP